VVYLLLLSYFLGVILLFIYLRHLKTISWQRFDLKLNKVKFREMVRFSFVFFLTGFTGILASKIDVVMLSAVSLPATGIYSIAFFMGTIIEIPKRALSQIAVPVISRAWNNNDMETIKTVYRKVSLNQTIIGSLLLVLLLSNLKDIFNLMPHSDIYIAGFWVVVVIGFARLFDMITGVNSEIITTSSFYQANFFMSVILGITSIAYNYVLIPKYGMLGAAVGTLASYIIVNSTRLGIIWYKLRVLPFSLKMLWVFSFALIAYLIVGLVPSAHSGEIKSFFLIGFRSALIGLIFIPLIYFFKISDDINNMINKVIRKII
jgi:O-antigen/teichoic acid export membrane protein